MLNLRIALLATIALGLRVALADPRAARKAPALDPDRLPLTESKYYNVHTDLDSATTREACIRMTKMAEEYHNRTADFTGTISTRLPFYLFKSADEYYAAGGPPSTAGIFDGHRLMAMGDKRMGGEVWHVVQHEGFHQFVHAVIGGDIPIWVDEGMAEYFGEGIFTGDGIVTGVISPQRMTRVLKTMDLPPESGGFHPLRGMMGLSHHKWNQEMNQQNYDQAWSMVQFLAHGDNGKYQAAFGHYMWLVSNGGDSDESWNTTFGSDTSAFDGRWRAYWKSLPPHPTSELYLRATVATLTSFLARAFVKEQRFTSFDTFIQAADAQKLQSSDEDWLPPTLLQSALRRYRSQVTAGDRFSFYFPEGGRIPEILCESQEGQRIVGKFVVHGQKLGEVNVTISGTKRPSKAPVSH